MGRRRWRERRGNPLRGSFDVDPWRPHDPDPEGDPKPEPSPRLVEHNNRALEAFKGYGISGADVRTPRLLCGADLGDGVTCRRWAGHERVGPDCSSQTGVSLIAEWSKNHPDATRAALAAGIGTPFAVGAGQVVRGAAEAEERAATERALNAGTSYTDPETGLTDDDVAALLDDLPPVSNPAPGLWEIVTGKPLPSYAELVERGRRAEHPTYDLLKVQATRSPELSSAEAGQRLADATGRTHLARRVMEVLPPALASQLALAVEEAVRRGIAEHVATERAVLAGMAEGAQARLQQSIEDQKRGREANAERFSTPSRLS